ncbi:hypothetical protein BH20ACI2_BH20ACI2_15920 [soil metagenome]
MMLQRLLLLACVLVIALGTIVVDFPEGVIAVGFIFAITGLVVIAIQKYAEERQFLTAVFLSALALRMGFGIFIHVFELREWFGSDALVYDLGGLELLDVWTGRTEAAGNVAFVEVNPGIGWFWGMNYLTASIYYLLGHNVFAAQSFCGLIGAATAPMVFFCAKRIFNNINVAKFSAVAITVFPSFIVWSGQLLKDGLVIFFLVTTITMVLQLQKKFSYPAVVALVISLFGILSLRFYIFYMVVVAVAGSFLVGLTNSNRSILRNTVVLAIVGFALTYYGIGRQATAEYEAFGSLEKVQLSRLDLSRSAESGFASEADVSTTRGALSTMPVGFAYLMLAPFPWEAANLRQAITIPEVLVWWATIPFLFIGLLYTIKNRLRSAFPILIFILLLTIAYSIFQGNVGTAYRQRTQIQVFMFILVGVGWTVFKEKRENERIIRQTAQRRVDERIRAGRLVVQK